MASAPPVNGNAQLPALNDATLAERVQIVDEDKTFNSELSGQIERWGLRDSGFNYNIVAVFGSQSTGKSTLLNRLFGTTFDVMDETRRQQTTKGIWMCRGKDMNVMVMDVEGTDGRERGEDQDFERKSALFSLASSEVLIVNMWEHQVGLYQGANMSLLKTVFEVNLGLFGKKSLDGGRTLLLFVIRDHIGATPLANLRATLVADLNRIWDTLSKPDDLKDRQLSDYFDLAFTGLPHKILVPEKFEAEVQRLRKRFTEKNDPDYVFKPAYHKRIPADGVAIYMQNIWEQVQSNKDLDLPTQQELLAQFRCDEISAGALAEFNEQAKSQKRPIEAGRVVEGLGALMKNWRNEALTRYDRDASRYHKGVYTRKRADLVSVIDQTLSPLFLGQLKNLHKLCLSTFKKDLLDGLKGDDYSFGDVVTKATKKCEDTFSTVAKEAFVEGTDWSWEEDLDLLKEETRGVADQCRKDETKKMVNQIERNIKKLVAEPVEIQLSKPSPQMWDGVLKTFKEVLAKAEATYLAKAKTFNCTDEENSHALASLRKRSWVALRSKIEEQTADQVLLGKLRAHFEEQFRYDEQGVPRVWKPEDDIDGAFKKAKEQTLELVPLYSRIKPFDPSFEFELPDDSTDDLANEDFEFASSLVVLSETKCLDLINKFRRDADAYYVEAKRSTVSSIAQIPYWMYGVLVVLGWNEAMAVLFNPLYFTFLLFGLATAYMIIQLGLTGPLLQVTKTVAGEVQRQATSKLREALAQPELAQPVRSGRSSRQSTYYEEERRSESPEVGQRLISSRLVLGSQTNKDSVTGANVTDALRVTETIVGMDIVPEMVDSHPMAFYAQQPPSYDAPHTTLTPYLQLPHLLSLTWLAYPIISLIFVAFRLSSSLDAAQNAIASAKDDLLASCRAAEEAATSAASMPRYMALATNQQFADAVNASLRGARTALTLSLTVMEAIINFIIDLYRSIFLCFLELVVRGGLAILIGAVNELNNVISTVTSGLRTSIQNDIAGANRAISGAFDVINRINPFNDVPAPQIPVPNLDGLANIQIPGSFQESLVRLNQTIPTVSSIKEKLEEIINTPFELLKKDINDTFATIQFNGSALPVPEQSRVSFCSELDMSVVDDIGRDILKAFKIGIVILIVIALVLVGLNCLLTWYKWRCMKAHLEYTRQAWNTDPTMIHTKGGSISSAPQVTLSDHNLMLLHANSSHPLITRITNQISALLRLSPSQHTNFQWFFNYVLHPPAAACLLIGAMGLLLVEIQLLAMGPMVAKYQGQAAETTRDFSLLIANSINDNMLNQSTIYAQQVNAEVDIVQNTINNGVFGWVNVTTTQLNTTINEFYDDVQNAVNTVFGGTILETPATEFIRCLIGSKVDAIENALTFLHDNLRVDMPRVNNTALLLSPDAVNEASAPIAAAALGGGSEDDQGLVGRLVNSYANTLKRERITFAIFLGLWGIVVFMAICVILWHSYGRPLVEKRRRRRYQMEQRGGLPDNLFRDGSVTPPNGVNGGMSRDEKWEGGMAVSQDLPSFTPLPSPRRSVFKPFWASRSNTPNPTGEETLATEEMKNGSEEKVSRLKAIRMKLKAGSKADPENGQQDSESSGGWFGKVKGVFARKEEPEPDPEFWESFNQRPKLKIIVDTPSDRSYGVQKEENPLNKPLPNSRWSTSPTEASWKALLSPKKTSSPKVAPVPTPVAVAPEPPAANRSLPPPPGLRHKPSVPSDIGGSFDDPFLSSVSPAPAPAIQSNNPYNASIIPSLYPIPLHSVYQGGNSSPVPPPTRRPPPSPPKVPSTRSSPSHKRTSSVPVWRVTNSTPADQISLNSSNTSLADTTVRPLPPTPPRELVPGHARHPSLAQARASEVNPFITPFDDEHRVEITSVSKQARKSMSANPFNSTGVAF